MKPRNFIRRLVLLLTGLNALASALLAEETAQPVSQSPRPKVCKVIRLQNVSLSMLMSYLDPQHYDPSGGYRGLGSELGTLPTAFSIDRYFPPLSAGEVDSYAQRGFPAFGVSGNFSRGERNTDVIRSYGYFVRDPWPGNTWDWRSHDIPRDNFWQDIYEIIPIGTLKVLLVFGTEDSLTKFESFVREFDRPTSIVHFRLLEIETDTIGAEHLTDISQKAGFERIYARRFEELDELKANHRVPLAKDFLCLASQPNYMEATAPAKSWEFVPTPSSVAGDTGQLEEQEFALLGKCRQRLFSVRAVKNEDESVALTLGITPRTVTFPPIQRTTFPPQPPFGGPNPYSNPSELPAKPKGNSPEKFGDISYGESREMTATLKPNIPALLESTDIDPDPLASPGDKAFTKRMLFITYVVRPLEVVPIDGP